ncbi:hypothetical protein AVEN_83996-1 [Araneus ventricosus]|uniref:Uncharacterized protein n=1 Tax=Araneus ventricosus TaxID=182803 RepID=A0A4Y2BRU9_ARAVE|nr:hypothetical protein AVEN_83996-1 [Araneus ventricosus]
MRFIERFSILEESVVYKEYEIYCVFMVCSTDLHAVFKTEKVVAESLKAARWQGQCYAKSDLEDDFDVTGYQHSPADADSGCPPLMSSPQSPKTYSERAGSSTESSPDSYVTRIVSKEGFVAKQAEEDADYLLIESALEIEKRSQCVVVVGEDIDLLVITAASTNSENIFFLKPGRGKAEDALYCAATLNIAPHIRDNILFLHAFSGSDTISALFRQGKEKFINVLNYNKL